MPDAVRDALAYQADHVTVPPPDADGVIRRGRRRAGRGRLVVAGAAAATVAVVAAGAVLFAPDSDRRPATTSPDASLALYQSIGPFAAGDTVYAGRATASVSGLSGLYASANAAVFKTDVDGGSDGAHDVVSSLTTDGVVHWLGETGFDTVVGTDPGSDLVAFTGPARDTVGAAGAVDIVIANAVTGDEVARTTFETSRFQGFDTPPASIHGTTAYVESADGWYAWDFASDQPPALVPDSAGAEIAFGVMAQWMGFGPVLNFYRLSDGSKMSSAGLMIGSGSLSPDGRYYQAVDGPGSPYYLDTRTGERLDGPDAPWFSFEGLIRQWSPSGNLVVIQFGAGGPGYDFTTCAMPSGPCHRSDFSIDHLAVPPMAAGQTAER
jgi:hypothetical protein